MGTMDIGLVAITMNVAMWAYLGALVGMILGFVGIIGRKVEEAAWMRECEEEGAWTDARFSEPDKDCHTIEEFEEEFEAAEEYPVVQPSVRRIEVAAARYHHNHIVMARDLAEIYANNAVGYETYHAAFLAMGRAELEMTWRRDLAA